MSNVDKNQSRQRRAKRTRMHIRKLGVARLSVHRSGQHIYAQVFSPAGDTVVAAASTLQKSVREGLNGTKNKEEPKPPSVPSTSASKNLSLSKKSDNHEPLPSNGQSERLMSDI